MDFIETLLGISPDNGTGVTEALFVAALVAAVALWATRGRWRRARADRLG